MLTMNYDRGMTKPLLMNTLSHRRQHFDYRVGRYGIAPLVWSAELADMAHAWAVKLSDRGRMLYPELPGELLLLQNAISGDFPESFFVIFFRRNSTG